MPGDLSAMALRSPGISFRIINSATSVRTQQEAALPHLPLPSTKVVMVAERSAECIKSSMPRRIR